jgi:hypothetical protein
MMDAFVSFQTHSSTPTTHSFSAKVISTRHERDFCRCNSLSEASRLLRKSTLVQTHSNISSPRKTCLKLRFSKTLTMDKYQSMEEIRMREGTCQLPPAIAQHPSISNSISTLRYRLQSSQSFVLFVLHWWAKCPHFTRKCMCGNFLDK